MRKQQLRIVSMKKPSEQPIPESPNFFHIIRPLLQIGRFTGIIPLIGVSSSHPNYLSFSWKSPAPALTLALIAVTTINLLSRVISQSHESTGVQRIMKVSSIIFSTNLVLMYIRFWTQKRNLVNLIHNWIRTNNQLHFNSVRLHSRIVMGILFGLGVVENLLHDVLCSTTMNEGTGLTFSVTQYLHAKYTHVVFSTHPVLAALYCLLDKLTVYSWNVADLMIIIMCRSLTFSFLHLKNKLETFSQNQTNLSSKPITCGDHLVLHAEESREKHLVFRAAQDFLKLRILSQSVSSFLSPLFIPSYTFHLMFISLHMHRWLMGDAQISIQGTNHIALIYVWVSLIQVMLRTFCVTFFASEVNHSVYLLLLAVQNNFPDTGKRLERMITSVPVGINVFGMKLVTRGLFISIISFIFSFQIVLLQTGTSDGGAESNSTKSDSSCSF